MFQVSLFLLRCKHRVAYAARAEWAVPPPPKPPPPAMLTRHVDQLAHTVLLLAVAEVLSGHDLHVLQEGPDQQVREDTKSTHAGDKIVHF